MKWFDVKGGGIACTMPALSNQTAREGFCRATGVHFNKVSAKEVILVEQSPDGFVWEGSE